MLSPAILPSCRCARSCVPQTLPCAFKVLLGPVNNHIPSTILFWDVVVAQEEKNGRVQQHKAKDAAFASPNATSNPACSVYSPVSSYPPSRLLPPSSAASYPPSPKAEHSLRAQEPSRLLPPRPTSQPKRRDASYPRALPSALPKGVVPCPARGVAPTTSRPGLVQRLSMCGATAVRRGVCGRMETILSVETISNSAVHEKKQNGHGVRPGVVLAPCPKPQRRIRILRALLPCLDPSLLLFACVVWGSWDPPSCCGFSSPKQNERTQPTSNRPKKRAGLGRANGTSPSSTRSSSAHAWDTGR